MTPELIGMIGLGLVSFLIFYFSKNLDDEKHTALKILGFMLVFGMLPLIPKLALDAQDYCSVEKVNETITLNTTTFEYDKVCVANENTTAKTFYTSTLWISRIVLIYVFLFYAVQMLRLFQKYKLRKGRI